jgi:hypothetical protein
MKQETLFAAVERTAWVSECGRYRHALGRHWDRGRGFVLFVGLNPSTADADKDDPTIRRCMRFARDWGYGGIEMCNLFDWRATDPKNLPRTQFAISEKGDAVLRLRALEASRIIAAWGSVPWAKKRIDLIFKTIFTDEKRWEALRITKHGYPQHPLYVPASVQPLLYW